MKEIWQHNLCVGGFVLSHSRYGHITSVSVGLSCHEGGMAWQHNCYNWCCPGGPVGVRLPVAEIQQYRQYWNDGWGMMMKGLLVEYNASHQCYFIHHGFVVTCTFYLQFHKQDPYSF